MTNPKSGVAESAGLACSRAAAGENRMKDSENKGKGLTSEGRLVDAWGRCHDVNVLSLC